MQNEYYLLSMMIDLYLNIKLITLIFLINIFVKIIPESISFRFKSLKQFKIKVFRNIGLSAILEE